MLLPDRLPDPGKALELQEGGPSRGRVAEETGNSSPQIPALAPVRNITEPPNSSVPPVDLAPPRSTFAAPAQEMRERAKVIYRQLNRGFFRQR